MKNIFKTLSEKFQFLEVTFSIYFYRSVFVMGKKQRIIKMEKIVCYKFV